MIPRRIEGMQKFQSSTFPSKYGWFMLCIVVLTEILKKPLICDYSVEIRATEQNYFPRVKCDR